MNLYCSDCVFYDTRYVGDDDYCLEICKRLGDDEEIIIEDTVGAQNKRCFKAHKPRVNCETLLARRSNGEEYEIKVGDTLYQVSMYGVKKYKITEIYNEDLIEIADENGHRMKSTFETLAINYRLSRKAAIEKINKIIEDIESKFELDIEKLKEELVKIENGEI